MELRQLHRTTATPSASAVPLRSDEPTPDAPQQPAEPQLTIRDRFVRGMGAGALGGTKSAMMMSVPLAAMAIDKSSEFIPKAWRAAMPFGTSAGSIATMTLTLAGTGAIVGGVTAAITHDKTWAPVLGGLTGGVLMGGVRGLTTKSWQGAAVGAAIGGITGYLSGRTVTRYH